MSTAAIVFVAAVAVFAIVISTAYLLFVVAEDRLAKRHRRRLHFDAMAVLREHRRVGLSDREIADALAPSGRTGNVAPFPVRPPIDYPKDHR